MTPLIILHNNAKIMKYNIQENIHNNIYDIWACIKNKYMIYYKKDSLN